MYERALNSSQTMNQQEALQEQAHALYGHIKYPRVEYAASDSRVIIYTAPSAFHGALVRYVLNRINKQQLLMHILLVGESTHEPDVMLWIDDFHCRTAILLWNNERPRFRNGGAYSVDERPLFPDAKQQVARVSPFGPYHYRDRSCITTTTCVKRTGDSVDIGLNLGDVFPILERTFPVHLVTDFLRNRKESNEFAYKADIRVDLY
ncbi:hypothetical protein V1508DRAFT_403388 [Lipomyces doorenjongii]|uniref:uncharacterized protein n=1 Tax=Lipomyces doorenjongii TaxID=383834 RepID=UPI0034CE0769